jgi:glycosyltransferase involved in cell wall biosynthesis
MEYMAYAKPIVTFDLKETRYSAREAAVYVPPNDEAKFAESIVQLMASPDLRQELGKRGRQRVERELQWAVVSRNLLTAYRSLQ